MGRAVTPALDRSIGAVARAEDSLVRARQLATMTAGELAAAFAGDPADALPWVRAAAAHGVVEAQTRLGRMLLAGCGAPHDPVAALRWFHRAAGAGDADAANMVGRCHENGWGTPADEAIAALWYRRSAEAGDDWGAYNHAHMLFDGRGVEIDRGAAYGWYFRAAMQGHARAMNLVGRCLEAGWGVAVDTQQAETWYERSAHAGYFRGQFNHAVGLAKHGDAATALAWLQRAFEGGDAAMRALIDAWFKAQPQRPAPGRHEPCRANQPVPFRH